MVVCFYDAILMLLIPSSATFILGTDGMAARGIVTFCSLFLGLSVMAVQGFKPLPTRWAALLLIFMAFSAYHSPNINFESQFVPHDQGLFNYKPMFESICFFLVFMGIYSFNFDRMKVLKALRTIGLIYSGYIILQHLGLDQLYKVVNDRPWELSRNGAIGGFISQPVFAGALLSICFPCILMFKKPHEMAFICVAVGLTGNRTALLALGITFLYYSRYTRVLSYYAIAATLTAVVAALILKGLNFSHIALIPDTGRLAVWLGLFKDFIDPAFPGIHNSYILTGHGIGSFSVLFPFYHNSPFFSAHNEYFELFYCLGIGGVVLLSLWIKELIFMPRDICLSGCLLAVSICALTNPVWHIPQLQYITVVLLALLYKRKEEDYALGVPGR